jgi:hypothetical protein
MASRAFHSLRNYLLLLLLLLLLFALQPHVVPQRWLWDGPYYSITIAVSGERSAQRISMAVFSAF